MNSNTHVYTITYRFRLTVSSDYVERSLPVNAVDDNQALIKADLDIARRAEPDSDWQFLTLSRDLEKEREHDRLPRRPAAADQT